MICYLLRPVHPWNKNAVEVICRSKRLCIQKSKSIISVGKIMSNVFQDAERIIRIYNVENDKTMNNTSHILTHGKTNSCNLKCLPSEQRTSPQRCIGNLKLKDLKNKLPEYESYSPDLVPFDIHLVPNVNKFQSGKPLGSKVIEEVIRAVVVYSADSPEWHFRA